MTLPGRRLRKYAPRRSKKILSIQKQEFLDCLHSLDIAAGSLIVLCKEGSVHSIQEAQAKARSHYLKFKDQLIELGNKIQETVGDRAKSYLEQYHTLVESALSYDESIFDAYYHSLLKLKAISSLKSKGLNQGRDSGTHSQTA